MPYLKTVSGVKSKMVQFNSFGRNPQVFAHTVWAARNMDPYHSFDMQVIFTTPTCICLLIPAECLRIFVMLLFESTRAL